MNLFKIKNKIILVALMFFAFIAVFTLTESVMAQGADSMFWDGQQASVQAATGLGDQDIRITIAKVIRVALGFLGIVALIIVLYGGFIWMTSGGAPDKIDKAKKILLSAVIGLVIIMLSFAIASFILSALYNAAVVGGGGTCDPPCGGTTPNCCSGSCQAGPCSLPVIPPGPGPTISCDSTPFDAICDADDTVCDATYGVGNYFCDTGCICQPLPSFGDPCDADTSTATCEPGACASDLYCDSDTCTCLGAPIIDWISPEDASGVPFGAEGNMITIGGRYFGDIAGEVFFYDSSSGTTSLPAPFPNSVNADCTDFWKDNTIVVIVPVGADDGPIKVVRKIDSAQDTSNDSRGPNIASFDVNSIVLPGICQLNPDNGSVNDTINYYGINLESGSDAFFGAYSSPIPTSNSIFTDPNKKEGTAQVPNISVGLTSTFVKSSTGNSNYLDFTKNSDSSSGPQISYFMDVEGSDGQYVTIVGSGFGWATLSQIGVTHFVYFDQDPSDTTLGMPADFVFPPECSNNLWTPNQIIMKVPSGVLTAGNYYLVITNGAWTIDSSNVVAAATPFGNISPTFNYDNSISLKPGLCKIEPTSSPNNMPISMWGEYFGNSGAVRFHSSVNTSGAYSLDGVADKIVVTVPQAAVSGPVKAVKGADASNGLNLKIGLCTNQVNPDDACGSQICCPVGTQKEGICEDEDAADKYKNCYNDVLSSVYEWDFSTGFGLIDPGDGDDLFLTCSVYNLDQCYDAEYCPNSPGECSSRASSTTYSTGVGCTDASCISVGACSAGGCIYNNDLNLCAKSGTCSLASTTQFSDILGNNAPTYCATYYNGNEVQSRWHMKTGLTCPTGWQMLYSGNVCVNTTLSCTLCSSDFECFNDSGTGVCAVNQKICPPGANCDSGQCIKTQDPGCECCCDITENLADKSNPSCCNDLTCSGDCGSDVSGPDTDTYGKCSGCKIMNGNTVDQAASDDACNCTGTAGRYCDTDIGPDIDGDGSPDGVCNDCAQMSDPEECTLHSATCCVDGANGDVCRQGNGTTHGDKNSSGYVMNASGGDSTLGYCSYYECNNNLDACNLGQAVYNTTVASSSLYTATSTCIDACGAPDDDGFTGERCINIADSLCDYGLPSCGYYFDCLSTTAGGDCRCCCTPGDDTTCSGDLECWADQGDCTGSNRGACCGCDSDAECSGGQEGCANNTCCLARPSIASTTPVDEATDVCRNTLISATFDRKMNISSFTGNVVVLGDYGTDPCPSGTYYLTLDGSEPVKKNVIVKTFAKLFEKIKNIFIHTSSLKLATAYTPPIGGRNYCAVSGGANGYNNAAGEGVLEFKSSRILDSSRRYYVVVKGDDNLTDSTKKGVLSLDGIGMNGPRTETFNGVTYTNSYVWQFTTMSDQKNNNGICIVDHVDINPTSFLFKKTTTGIGENDTDANNLSFDTVYDNDKVFSAIAKTLSNQSISPTTEYSWSWDWNTSASTIANIVGGVSNMSDNKSLIRAGSQTVDGRAIISSTLTITASPFAFSPVGTTRQASSDVYVFICENPWPPINSSGLWSPWRDAAGNCDISAGGCPNTNYEIYYCRDRGMEGTIDDLSVINNNPTIRGSQVDTLKESYFFREVSPTITSVVDSLSVSADAAGGSVSATWSSVSGSSYKLYWGTSANNLTDYSNVVSSGAGIAASNPSVSCDSLTSCTVDGLIDGNTYYFNVTAFNSGTGAESSFYNTAPVEVVPADTLAPAAPSGLTAVAGDGFIDLYWNTVADAVDYKVFFGISSGVYGNNVKTGGKNKVRVEGGLQNENTYYFVISSIDAAGNESSFSSGVSATPTSLAPGYFGSGEVVLNWNTDGTVGEYLMYLEEIE